MGTPYYNRNFSIVDPSLLPRKCHNEQGRTIMSNEGLFSVTCMSFVLWSVSTVAMARNKPYKHLVQWAVSVGQQHSCISGTAAQLYQWDSSPAVSVGQQPSCTSNIWLLSFQMWSCVIWWVCSSALEGSLGLIIRVCFIGINQKIFGVIGMSC